MSHLPVFPWKGSYCILYKLLTNMQLLLTGILLTWRLTGLGIPSTTGSHQKQRQWPDNHKGLRGNQDLGRLIDEIHLLHKTSLSRSGEVAILSTMQKPTHRIKGNKEEYVPNKRTR